jgi:hypothetical protein
MPEDSRSLRRAWGRISRRIHAIRSASLPASSGRRAAIEASQQRPDLGQPEARGLCDANQRETIEELVAVNALAAAAFAGRDQPRALVIAERGGGDRGATSDFADRQHRDSVT